MTTTHRNYCNSTELVTVKYKPKKPTLTSLESKTVVVWGTQIMFTTFRGSILAK